MIETTVRSGVNPDGQTFDVVIVGGRIAGCAMAIHLVRSGLRVAVVERDAVPSDTLSTHLIQDLDLFEELGALGAVLACGAPPLLATNIHIDGVDLSAANPDKPWLCLRRIALDEVLSGAVEQVGATLLKQTSVVDLLRAGECVTGVIVQGPDGLRREIPARMVVGADGRNSTVARLVGARKYDITHNERTAYWNYYAGLPMPNVFHFARRGRDLVLVAPCDGGLTLVAAQPPLDDDREWRDPAMLEAVAGDLVGPLRGMLPHAKAVGDVRVVRRMDGFFREANGPGWVLVGDAGHFKDIVVGQGICDAIRQARSLSRRLATDLPNPQRLDTSLRVWWRERDADALPMYWLAQDLGRVKTTVLDQEVLRVLAGSAKYRRKLHQVLAHRSSARRVVGPSVQAQAVARAALRVSVSRSDLLTALSAAAGRERQRRSADRRPAYGL
jgi:2-polyprenyl-6-methoxyphenol hydroxylase-like FAD-dependent oxidoreductase